MSKLWSEFVGPAERPVVVLAHALGGDSSMWDSVVPELSQRYRVLRYDLPGHGQSSPGGGLLTLEGLASDVLQLADGHGVERFHFCGLSLGGLIGQWLGLNAPERLCSLILVDSAPRMGSVDTWNQRIEQIEREGLSSISAGTMNRWFTDAFRQQDPGLIAHFQTVLENTSLASYIACAKAVRDAQQQGVDPQRFPSIPVPVLVAVGKFDSAANPGDCAAMASRIQGSRYVELEAAHISPVEASQAFTTTLLDFLRSE